VEFLLGSTSSLPKKQRERKAEILPPDFRMIQFEITILFLDNHIIMASAWCMFLNYLTNYVCFGVCITHARFWHQRLYGYK
jgi:hypothetical protein